MLTNSKNNKTKDEKVGDFGNDPFFVEKAKKSKEFLEKHGFPEELLNSRKSSFKKI